MTDNSSLNSLLTPSLPAGANGKPMYSITAHVLVAFFGGSLAFLLFSMYSTHHIGRLQHYRWYYVSVVAVAVTAWCLGCYQLASGWPDQLLLTSSATSSLNQLDRGLGLLICGVTYLLQRRYFAVSSLSDQDYPSPWKPGLIAAFIGFLWKIVTASLPWNTLI